MCVMVNYNTYKTKKELKRKSRKEAVLQEAKILGITAEDLQ